MDLGMFIFSLVHVGVRLIESHEQYAYTLCYLNALGINKIFRQPLILLELYEQIINLFWLEN